MKLYPNDEARRLRNIKKSGTKDIYFWSGMSRGESKVSASCGTSQAEHGRDVLQKNTIKLGV